MDRNEIDARMSRMSQADLRAGASYLFATGDKDFLKDGHGDRRFFAFRDSPSAPLQFVLAPGEEVRPGDWVVLDRATDKVRKAVPEDTGQKFVVPPGSRVNDRGYLKMPYRIPNLMSGDRIESLPDACTRIADQVVPQYRDDNQRQPGYSCTGIYAKRRQAAWDAACIALGGDPKEYAS